MFRRGSDEQPVTRQDRYWGYLEQVGLGAFVAAVVILAGLGISKLAHLHPNDSWIFEATALVALGLLVLAASVARRRHVRSAARRKAARAARANAGQVVAADPAPAPAPAAAPENVWTCSADTHIPGVLLFVLDPSHVASSAADLGPVACFVADPAGVGQRANDDRISRARGVLTVRWHPSFFFGVPEPVNGEYRYRWDELQPSGEWKLLATGSLAVSIRPSPEVP